MPGEKDTDEGAIDVTEGGTAIPYWLEDPFLRKEYEETWPRKASSRRWMNRSTTPLPRCEQGECRAIEPMAQAPPEMRITCASCSRAGQLMDPPLGGSCN